MSVTGIGAPEGATHYGPDTDSHCESWYRVEGGAITAFVPVGDHPFVLSPAQAGAAYYHNVDELVEIWTGSGLPPVGTVCERNSESGEWVSTKILAHSHLGYVAAYEDVFSPYHLGWCKRESDFRPIRTPEQIAAEEREKAIAAMIKLCPYPGSDCTRIDCAALYDAGLRFEVTP